MTVGLRGIVVVVVVIAVFDTPVAAQDADALIAEGFVLREQGLDAEALDHFERAHEQQPSSRALAQIALAEQALGRFVVAERHLHDAMEQGGEWIEQNRGALERALSVLEGHLGSVELVGGAAGATVLVDGDAVAELPLPVALRVPAGAVRVSVRAEGHHPFARTVQVRPGGLARIDVQLVPEPVATQEPGPPPARPLPAPERPRPLTIDHGPPVPAILSFAAAGAALSGAVGAALWWIDRNQALTACDSMPRCLNGDDLQVERDAAAGTTIGLVVVASALSVMGLLFLRAAPNDAAEVAVRCGPLGCTGSF